MLIVNDHESHVTTDAIAYCIQRKIILLCLLSHTTYLLQSLNVNVFASLITACKARVQQATRLEEEYSINKVNFIKLYQKA